MRHLILSVDQLYEYNTLDQFAKVCYKGDSDALKDAEIGKVYTMNSFMSQNAPQNVSATAGSATAYKVIATKDESKFTVSAGAPATGTIKKGDKVIVNGYLFECAEDLTLVSGAGNLKVTEKVPFVIETAKDVVIVNKPHSLAFHRNGLALVTRALELPQGAAKAAIASADGLAVRVVFGYDQNKKKDCISFDIIYGIPNRSHSETCGLYRINYFKLKHKILRKNSLYLDVLNQLKGHEEIYATKAKSFVYYNDELEELLGQKNEDEHILTHNDLFEMVDEIIKE